MTPEEQTELVNRVAEALGWVRESCHPIFGQPCKAFIYGGMVHYQPPQSNVEIILLAAYAKAEMADTTTDPLSEAWATLKDIDKSLQEGES